MVLAGFAGFLDSLWLLHQLISLPWFHHGLMGLPPKSTLEQ